MNNLRSSLQTFLRWLPTRCRASAMTLAIATSLYAGGAVAYTRAESNWNPASLPIQYRVNLSSAPASIGPEGARSAIEAGMASWSMPACTRWQAVNAGTTTVTRASTRDRTNTFLWISDAWPPELGDVNSTIGVTTPVWTVGGYFVDADIQFNNVGFQWSLDGRRGTVDTQSIAVHEEGHFLGLNHSSSFSAVMYAAYPGGIKRTLTSDDINGVCAIYPSGSPLPDAGTPPDGGTSNPCARLTSCDGCTPVDGCGWCGATSQCMPGNASGPIGGSCAGNWAWLPSDCRSGTTDPCNRYTTCGTCTPISGCGWCGAMNRCVSGTMSGPRTGSCSSGWAWLPMECTDGSMGTSGFGEPCTRPGDCASGGVCVSDGTTAFCSRPCNDDCNCPRGYRCVPTTTSGLSVCAPGTNRCTPSNTDSGVPTNNDASVPPIETDASVQEDAGTMPNPLDASTGSDGSRDARNTGSGSSPGCACSVPGRPFPHSGVWHLVAFASAAWAMTRRRRQ